MNSKISNKKGESSLEMVIFDWSIFFELPQTKTIQTCFFLLKNLLENTFADISFFVFQLLGKFKISIIISWTLTNLPPLQVFPSSQLSFL